MTATTDGACRLGVYPIGTGGTGNSVVMPCECASENRGHISGQKRSDGEQRGADHGGITFEKRPDHYIRAVPCFVVGVGSYIRGGNTYMLHQGSGFGRRLCI